MVGPQLTANTTATGTGEEAARFSCKLGVNIKSKHFAEHGYIVGLATCRPIHLSGPNRPATDIRNGASGTSNADWLNTFYSADNLQTKDPIDEYTLGTNSDAYAQRFAYLKNGSWIGGNGSDWIPTGAGITYEGLIKIKR